MSRNRKGEQNSNYRHGHGKPPSSTYRSWLGMKARCLRPSCGDYPDYGGRGITICERWVNSFQNFLDDMGECPTGLTLERKKNHLNYTPTNCCWATRKEQANNRRKRSPHTPESNAKRSTTLKGRKLPPRSAEHSAKLSAALKGNKNCVGRKIPKKVRANPTVSSISPPPTAFGGGGEIDRTTPDQPITNPGEPQ